MVKKKEKSLTAVTNKTIEEILPKLLDEVKWKYNQTPQEVIDYWDELVGQQIAKMTVAKSLDKGVLKVEVHNSTLHSLLVEHEKPRLLRQLKERFPRAKIQNIVFKIG